MGSDENQRFHWLIALHATNELIDIVTLATHMFRNI